MREVLKHPISAVLLGPLAYFSAGRKRRAVVGAIAEALLVLSYAYWQYLPVFEALDVGGDTVRDAFRTAVAAVPIWLAGAPSWALLEMGMVLAFHVACALDLGVLSIRGAA